MKFLLSRVVRIENNSGNGYNFLDYRKTGTLTPEGVAKVIVH